MEVVWDILYGILDLLVEWIVRTVGMILYEATRG